MAAALTSLPYERDPKILVGLETADDAGVYQLDEETALIQTVDFITPIVDDPFTFGQIAAANSLSDVYAMGGRPLTALNLVAFPACALPPETLTEIMRGGLDKIHEAGCLLVGGHTIDDEELKYGLCVTGIIHPAKLLTNSGAQAGDRLLLTKPLGTGIITTAHKGGVASSRTLANAVDSMRRLNGKASEIAVEAGAHAAVDITGFGFLGHSSSMAQASGVTLVFEADRIPLMEGVEEYAAEGLVPGGAHKNREYYAKGVQFRRKIPPDLELILFDPQTSGGLLIAAPASQAQGIVARLKTAGIEVATSVGEVHPKREVSVEIF